MFYNELDQDSIYTYIEKGHVLVFRFDKFRKSFIVHINDRGYVNKHIHHFTRDYDGQYRRPTSEEKGWYLIMEFLREVG